MGTPNACDWQGQPAQLNAAWLDAPLPAWNYVYHTSKVRLTIVEINKLRSVASQDEALKAVLKKFTDHIEVAVDF